MDGDYSPLAIQCGVNATNGTVGSTVTVQAQNDRRAYIHSPTQNVSALSVTDCTWWSFAGLRLAYTSDDNPVLKSQNSSFLDFRRILISHTGHGTQLPGCDTLDTICPTTKHEGVHFLDSSNILAEDFEIYDYENWCFKLYNGSTTGGHTLRRIYCNKRTSVAFLGVGGYPSNSNTYENIIVEGHKGGGNLASGWDGYNNHWYGSIFKVLADGFGDGWGSSPAGVHYGNTSANILVLGNAVTGIYLDGTGATTRNSTVIGAIFGFSSYDPAQAAPNPSFTCINCLAINNTTGFYVDTADVPTFSIQNPATYNNGTAFNPPASNPNITGEIALNATNANLVTACPIFIHSSATQLKGTGVGNADIGANILYAYENGVQNFTKPLWNPTTREINTAVWQGARITGVNDANTANSLANIGTRLLSGCTSGWPVGYGAATTVAITITGPTSDPTYPTYSNPINLSGTATP